MAFLYSTHEGSVKCEVEALETPDSRPCQAAAREAAVRLYEIVVRPAEFQLNGHYYCVYIIICVSIIVKTNPKFLLPKL